MLTYAGGRERGWQVAWLEGSLPDDLCLMPYDLCLMPYAYCNAGGRESGGQVAWLEAHPQSGSRRTHQVLNTGQKASGIRHKASSREARPQSGSPRTHQVL